MTFQKLLFGLVATVALCGAQAQSYSPARGETVVKVTIENRGNLFIRLFTAEAPRTTTRILELVSKGFYDGQKFHKVEKSPRPFLVQVGAPSSRSKAIDDPSLKSEGTGTRIPYEESGISNDQEGIVGLSALPGDRDSGDCQFHILLGPAKFLNGNYTVFGKVVSGIEVLRKIEVGDRISSTQILRG